MKNIAIFASGNGTNCENIIRHFEKSEYARVSLVVCNNASAKVTERAERLGVPLCIVTRQDLGDSTKLLPKLEEMDISLIVLAGFMLFIPGYLIDAFPHKIINIHPSLLPKFGGKGMFGIHVHEAVKAAGETVSGITIHYVSKEYDKGEIICQEETRLSPSDSPADIATKVHRLEYEHYPAVIEKLLKED